MKIKLPILIIFIGSSAFAIKNEPKEVTLFLDDQHQYKVPEEIVKQTGLAPLVSDGKLKIESIQITPEQVQFVAEIMESAYKNKNLKGKALLDAIAKEINLTKKNDFEILNLLKAADYFDFPRGLQLLAREVANRPPPLITVARDLKNEGEISQDAFDEIGRIVYLTKNTSSVSGLSKNALRFSIRDYLDYMPEAIKLKSYVGTISLQPRREEENVELLLMGLNLNNLEGLREIKNIEKVTRLLLNNNFIENIGPKDFPNMPFLRILDLDKNQITQVDHEAFSELPSLEIFTLTRNRITSLPANLFKNNRKLEYVSLIDNKLSHLDNNFFKNLNKLRIVDLSINKFKIINPRIFDGLPQVKVELQENPLTDETKKLIQEWNIKEAKKSIEEWQERHGSEKTRELPSAEQLSQRKLPRIDF